MNDEAKALAAKLTPVQIRYAALRAISRTDADAFRAVGISRQTLSVWNHAHPELQQLIELLAQDTVEQARLGLENLLSNAVATLGKAMDGKDIKAAVSAANSILDRGGLPATNRIVSDATVKGYVSVSPDDWDDDKTEPEK